MIEGIGPRYCPSIEDKVVKFPDKERHQLFLEPKGLHTNEVYVQGMSSSLPVDVQDVYKRQGYLWIFYTITFYRISLLSA